jgi:hypothetical protein
MAEEVLSATAPKHDVGARLASPWRLPAQGFAVFHGAGDVARLSPYFLPRLLLEGKRVLFLDGANSADPRLLERFARERNVPFAEFNRGIQIARAFTCFQLTELIARVPRFLEEFPAQVVIVTAFPDLYFDDDVRDWNARVAFEQALANLRRWAGGCPLTPSPSPPRRGEPGPILNLPPSPAGRGKLELISDSLRRDRSLIPSPLPQGEGGPTASDRVRGSGTVESPIAVAVFSAAQDFAPSPARRRFFLKLCAAASEVWKFSVDADNRLKLITDPLRPRLGRSAGILPALR